MRVIRDWCLFLLLPLVLSVFGCSKAPELKIDRDASNWLTPEEIGAIRDSREEGREELYSVSFRLPPYVLRQCLREDDVNPFAEFSSTVGFSLSKVQKMLESAGIEFDTGASVRYEPHRSELIVVQTKAQLELLEAYFDGGIHPEKTVLVELEVFSVSPLDMHRVLESVQETYDQSPEREAVWELLQSRSADLIGSYSVRCRSGQMASVSIFESAASDDEEGSSGPKVDGLLKVDVVVGADEWTTDVAGEVRYSFENRIYESSIGTTALSGKWYLIASQLSEGRNRGEKVGHLIFLRSSVSPLSMPVMYAPVVD